MPSARLKASALGAAVVLAVVAGVAVARADTYSNGPFGHADSSYGSSYGLAKGTVFTDGMHILQNLSDHPVRLLGVEFEQGEPGLELVGAKVAGLDRGIGQYQRLPSFPPVSTRAVVLGPLEDLEGYVIPPHGEYRTKGVELLLGIRKTVDDRASRRALLIRYEVDGEKAVARMVGALAVCEVGRDDCFDDDPADAI